MAEKIKKSTKRLVRKRIKKERISKIDKELKLAIETGEVMFGYRNAIKSIFTKDPKVIVISNNARKDVADDIKHYASIGNIPLIEYNGTSLQLGTVCGKPFPVSVLVIFNPGESNIVALAK